MRIVCSAGAPEFEEVPRSRLKLSWIIQLQYYLDNTFAVSELLAGTRADLAKLLVQEVIRMGLGAVMLPKSLFLIIFHGASDHSYAAWSGTIAGAFGDDHQE
jgi:hypothetical protein